MNIKTIIPQNTNIKLSLATRYGYGTASIADTIILDFVSAFFLFFLTNIVGINPALAGSVALIGVLWDAITDPIIGNMADKSTAKHGKYRRFILISILPIFICTVLLFLKVNFSYYATFIYYLVVSMMYYTSYTVFNIPYMALGSSLTSNEIEKTKLSGVRQSFGFAGALFSGAIPALLIDYFQVSGLSNDKSYTITAAILGLFSVLTIFITWYTTKGHELDFTKDDTNKEKLWQSIKGIFSCKPYVLLIAASLTFFIGFTMIVNCLMFVIIGILGLSEGAASGIFVLIALAGIAISFLLSKIAEKVDKRIVYVGAMLIAVLYMIFTKFIGINSLLGFAVYIVMVDFGFSAFLVFIYNFLYDVVDIIEFKTNSRNSGMIFSYYSFIVKFGKAGALQLVGILLAVGGYDTSIAIQGESGSRAILNMVTVWPSATFLLSIILILIYPVTRKRIISLQNAISLKREGKPFTTEDFEKII